MAPAHFRYGTGLVDKRNIIALLTCTDQNRCYNIKKWLLLFGYTMLWHSGQVSSLVTYLVQHNA